MLYQYRPLLLSPRSPGGLQGGYPFDFSFSISQINDRTPSTFFKHTPVRNQSHHHFIIFYPPFNSPPETGGEKNGQGFEIIEVTKKEQIMLYQYHPQLSSPRSPGGLQGVTLLPSHSTFPKSLIEHTQHSSNTHL